MGAAQWMVSTVSVPGFVTVMRTMNERPTSTTEPLRSMSSPGLPITNVNRRCTASSGAPAAVPDASIVPVAVPSVSAAKGTVNVCAVPGCSTTGAGVMAYERAATAAGPIVTRGTTPLTVDGPSLATVTCREAVSPTLTRAGSVGACEIRSSGFMVADALADRPFESVTFSVMTREAAWAVYRCVTFAAPLGSGDVSPNVQS